MAHLKRNQLINRLCDAHLLRLAKLYASGRMIDIGCGEKQYEDHFRPFVTEHIGVDHPDTQHTGTKADIFSSGYEIPVPEAGGLWRGRALSGSCAREGVAGGGTGAAGHQRDPTTRRERATRFAWSAAEIYLGALARVTSGGTLSL